MKRFMLVVAALLVASATRDAAAQGFVSPFIGTTLTSPSPSSSSSKPGYGIAFGNLGKMVGFDTEIAYFPEILDNSSAIAKSHAFTFSADTLIGPMIGPIKAYGAVGAGNMYLNVTSVSSIAIPTDISSNKFTFNVGGGVMGFFTDHLGVRGDLRYFRAYGFNLTDLETAGLKLDHFDFWRASIGFAAKF